MTDHDQGERVATRSTASFLSSSSTFSLPAGRQVTPGKVSGYYIDLRVKADAPGWPSPRLPPPSHRLHVVATQWGLGSYERYLAGEGEQWLAGARRCADELVDLQESAGPLAGGWRHHQSLRHTFALRPPWLSAMAQGEGASLLVRICRETGDERYAEAARRALEPFDVDSRGGGVRALLDGRPFPEEYPTHPPSLVLNGGMFAIWGLYDVGVGLAEQRRLTDFEEAVTTLAANLHRWDLGYWSRYDLFPHPMPNIASSFYHDLHVNQLRIMHRLAPHPEFRGTAERWEDYAASSLNRARAFVQKGLFRLVVPRSQFFARRLPWSALKPTRVS